MLRPRIALLLQRSPADGLPSISAVTAELIARLRDDKGADVDLVLPEDHPIDLGAVVPTHDLYVLKAETPLTLGIAAAVAARGAPVVNRVEACTLTRDKLAATAVLAAAGVPVPPTWATACAGTLPELLADAPLWLKPQRGSHGVGVRRMTSIDDLHGIDDATRDPYGLPLPVLVQRDVPSSGLDLKVYIVGDQMWAIARPFPARTLEEKLGTPAPIAPAIRMAALVAGAALGLEVYGVDVLVAGDAFWVVDVNAFPGYKGVPQAPAALADFMYEKAHSALCSGT